MTGNRGVKIGGREDWSAAELEEVLWKKVNPSDLDSLGGAVRVLCRRVAELEERLSAIEKKLESNYGA